MQSGPFPSSFMSKTLHVFSFPPMKATPSTQLILLNFWIQCTPSWLKLFQKKIHPSLTLWNISNHAAPFHIQELLPSNITNPQTGEPALTGYPQLLTKHTEAALHTLPFTAWELLDWWRINISWTVNYSRYPMTYQMITLDKAKRWIIFAYSQ